MIHGENGVSQKGRRRRASASHYISLTRLATSGTIDVNGTNSDSERRWPGWTTNSSPHQLEADQAGWDWFSLQLDDNTEIMLFHMRRKDGSIDQHSAGTYVDASGKTTNLKHADFALQPAGDTWTSPNTQATYPIHWKIAIPRLQIALDATTPLASQELASKGKLVSNVLGRRNHAERHSRRKTA